MHNSLRPFLSCRSRRVPDRAITSAWAFESVWNTQLIEAGMKTRNRSSGLSLRERITQVIAFDQMGYRSFKDF